MEEIISLLEEELSCLRQILSNLAMEETALISGDLKPLSFLNQELQKLKKEEKTKRKKREVEIEKIGLPTSALHEISLIEQAHALQEKIKAQFHTNQELKKQFNNISFPTPLPKPKPKKKPLPPQVMEKE